MKNKKSANDGILFNLKSKTVAKIISGVSFGVIILSEIVKSLVQDKFTIICFNILESIGLTLLSVGLISLIMEISTIESVVKKAINNVLSVDFPIESYSESHLNKLKTKISMHCLNCTENDLKKSVYKLEPNLLELTKSMYYEYHDIKCTVIPDDKSNVFTKKYKMTYKIINRCSVDNRVKIGIALYDLIPNMTDEERRESVKFTKFLVNGVDLLNDSELSIKIQPLNEDAAYEYDYIYTFERPLQKCREHIVELEYEYKTLQTDLTQSWRLRYPCKKTEHTISIKGNNNWNLKANAFASFFHAGSKLANDFKVEQTVDNQAKIQFSEWAIPGAGYVVSYNKK